MYVFNEGIDKARQIYTVMILETAGAHLQCSRVGKFKAAPAGAVSRCCSAAARSRKKVSGGNEKKNCQ